MLPAIEAGFPALSQAAARVSVESLGYFMPYILTNPDQFIDYGRGSKDDYGYKYPNNLDLKPGSKLHQETLGKLLTYARDSASIISLRFDKWGEIDNKLQAFIPISAEEVQVKRADPRKPVSIVFPYSYAILETLVSYLVSAFTPEPIFRYEGCRSRRHRWCYFNGESN